jgi:hypothetical protein
MGATTRSSAKIIARNPETFLSDGDIRNPKPE